MTAIEQFSEGLRGRLRPYYCTGENARTGHPCRTMLLEAWSPAGAVVRRRCKQCGTWQMIIVAGGAPFSESDASVLD